MSSIKNLLKPRAKSLDISEKETTYKVKYLGNVLTAFMKGEGCVDRPASILFKNYNMNKSSPLNMSLTICSTGLKVLTEEQGLTEYRFHRISYCCIYSDFPKIFIWVYRHEGKKLKVELRCHAVLCKTESISRSMVDELHHRLEFALAEFTREKTRRQNSRLILNHSFALASNLPSPKSSTRTKFLTVGQNFKPPADRSTSAPKLHSITEDAEEGEEEEEEEEDHYKLKVLELVNYEYADDTDSLLFHENGCHIDGCLDTNHCHDNGYHNDVFHENNVFAEGGVAGKPLDNDSGESGFGDAAEY